MKPVKQVLSAAGSGDWIVVPHSGLQGGFGVGVGVVKDATATANYTVEHSFDDPQVTTNVKVSSATNTVTVTFPAAHNKITADSITMTGCLNVALNGTFPVASTATATTLTYTITSIGTLADKGRAVVFSVFPCVDINGLTAAQAETAYIAPPAVIRLTANSISGGNIEGNFVFAPS